METKFEYNRYDSLLNQLLTMSRLMVENWDSYGTMEMNYDLSSIHYKLGRLCVMAEMDYASQMADITHSREVRTQELLAAFNYHIYTEYGPFLKRIITSDNNENFMKGRKWDVLKSDITSVLPYLQEYLSEECDMSNWGNTVAKIQELEKLKAEKIPSIKMTGLDERQRLWLLFENYTMSCYLLYHFDRTAKIYKQELSTEEETARFLQTIQIYKETAEGRNEISTYLRGLEFDNDGPLSIDQLKEARKQLRKRVPQSLQLCFMNCINDLHKLVMELRIIHYTSEEMILFISIVAKWQILTQKIEELEHPEERKPVLYNKVFNTIVHDQNVNMLQLRERIHEMLRFVDKKNQWFCVWSVLRYHSLLKSESHKDFADQMMHADWFGAEKGILRFTNDTLQEYSGYFTATYFPAWNQESYNIYRNNFNKKKWGDSLCTKFKQTCERMERVFANNV